MATGVAIQKGAEVAILKKDIPAWEFVGTKEYGEFIKSYLPGADTVLIHTRAATQGDPADNENNHPISAGKVAVVHNGMIHNDGHLFSDMKLKREAEVDSDILRAILDSKGLNKDGLNALQRVRGSAAIAAVSTAEPGKLLLARSGSPLVLASTPKMLVWASEKQPIHTAMRPWVKRFGVLFQPNRADLAFITLNDNSAWLFEDGKLAWHEEFSACASYTKPKYDVHNNFQSNRARWKHDKRLDVAICPNAKCKKANLISEEYEKVPIWELECEVCNTRLGDEPSGGVGTD